MSYAEKIELLHPSAELLKNADYPFLSGYQLARKEAAEIALEADRRIEAAEGLATALRSTQMRIGCGCGGDAGLCIDCVAVDAEVETALAAWSAAKETK